MQNSEAMTDLRTQVEAKLDHLEKDMILLEAENERLRKNTESTYFERDACVSLILQLAARLGMQTGKAERTTAHGIEKLVILDLPAGQVCWEYLPAEAHLFEALPEYTDSIQQQSIGDIYAKVMNPGLSVS